jgi:chaperone modulatory protein CbpM
MVDDPADKIEQVAAEFIQYGWVRRERICRQLGIGEDVLELCIQWQIIESPHPNPEGHLVFSSDAVDRLCRGLRLHRDLGLNWPGVSVAMELLDRIDDLEHRLRELSGPELMDWENKKR